MSTSEAPDLTHATIEELVAHSIVVILKAQAAMMASTNNPNSEPRKTSVARKCDYEKFTSYQLFYFSGTDGAVGLIRWFKRTESIFSRSKCADINYKCPPKRTSTSKTPAITLDAIRQLTADFTAALEAQTAAMASASNLTGTPAVKTGNYKEFISCQPFCFNGTEGAVCLIPGLNELNHIHTKQVC
ncbi:hypothetical protein Tco_0237101 [Tanacetum coccineum]